MTLELNASDERGIDVVRQQIQDFASTRSVFSNTFKLVILDECDAMTRDAQFALRRGEGAPPGAGRGAAGVERGGGGEAVGMRGYGMEMRSHSNVGLGHHLILPPRPLASAVIEKYTRNTRFCLICNYVIKIIPALQSRCTRFRFPPLAPEHVRLRLEHVAQAEG